MLKVDHMQECSCKEDIAVFYCKQLDCPSNKTQPFYCILCSENPEKHDHKNIRIVKETEELTKKWNELRTSIITT